MYKLHKNNKTLGYIKLASILIIVILSIVIYITYPSIIYTTNMKLKREQSYKINDVIEEDYLYNEGNYTKNTLIIPRIQIKAEILEGTSIETLSEKEGVWREPNTSTPPEKNNMVLAGHRRQFLPPNTVTFYLLPKLKKGDYIIVFWNSQKYQYEVIKSFETNRYDSTIYEETNNTTLTLYTCTPVWTATKRWVVQAERKV